MIWTVLMWTWIVIACLVVIGVIVYVVGAYFVYRAIQRGPNPFNSFKKGIPYVLAMHMAVRWPQNLWRRWRG